MGGCLEGVCVEAKHALRPPVLHTYENGGTTPRAVEI